jgi:hypothetical protein
MYMYCVVLSEAVRVLPPAWSVCVPFCYLGLLDCFGTRSMAGFATQQLIYVVVMITNAG